MRVKASEGKDVTLPPFNPEDVDVSAVKADGVYVTAVWFVPATSIEQMREGLLAPTSSLDAAHCSSLGQTTNTTNTAKLTNTTADGEGDDGGEGGSGGGHGGHSSSVGTLYSHYAQDSNRR